VQIILAAVLAAEAVPEVPANTPWYAYVLTTVGIALAGFLVRWLEAQAKVRAEQLAQMRREGKTSLKMASMEALVRITSNIACKELKELQALAHDGVVDKPELHKLGRQALEDVKAEFRTQGVDLIKELGEDFLKSGLRYIVDKFKARKESD